MQTSSNELYLIAWNVNKQKLILSVIIFELVYIAEMAKRLDAMSSIKLGGF